MFRVGILIINDQSARGEREDESGPMIQSLIPEYYEVVHYKIVPEEHRLVHEKMSQWATHCDLIVTTGATGITSRDITPEATMELIDRTVPGIAEAVRASGNPGNPQAMLSRAVAGVRDRTLIVNLPGGPQAVREALTAILPTLDYALERLRAGIKAV